jgi:hypothetical protein
VVCGETLTNQKHPHEKHERLPFHPRILTRRVHRSHIALRLPVARAVSVTTNQRTGEQEMKYRILGPGEVIQAGDEWFDGTSCEAVIGESVLGYYMGRIVRPIPAPDELTRDLAETLAACAWMIKDKSPSEYSKANAVLAKYKEQLKVYETVDGKAVKCA